MVAMTRVESTLASPGMPERATSAGASLLERWPELLAFRAPYLEEKLVKERVVATTGEAARLFDEVKKYLVLTRLHPDAAIPMFSRRVDEAWHQFVLYTRQYSRFSEVFFGTYVHHAPSASDVEESRRQLTFIEFRAAYERIFGRLSPLWNDPASITCATRVLRVTFGRPFDVRIEGDSAALVLLREPPMVMLRAEACARVALELVTRLDTFYVRELAGLRADTDRVDLARALVQVGVLRIAP
jgi:hypothetical protein